MQYSEGAFKIKNCTKKEPRVKRAQKSDAFEKVSCQGAFFIYNNVC